MWRTSFSRVISAVLAVITSLPSRSTVMRSEICRAFLERVRDVDDGDAAGAQVADQVEEVDDLFRRQARRRLIEDDDTGVVVDGAGDLDHLPLGGAEQPDRRRRIDMEVQRLQQLLRLDVQLLEAA